MQACPLIRQRRFFQKLGFEGGRACVNYTLPERLDFTLCAQYTWGLRLHPRFHGKFHFCHHGQQRLVRRTYKVTEQVPDSIHSPHPVYGYGSAPENYKKALTHSSAGVVAHPLMRLAVGIMTISARETRNSRDALKETRSDVTPAHRMPLHTGLERIFSLFYFGTHTHTRKCRRRLRVCLLLSRGIGGRLT